MRWPCSQTLTTLCESAAHWTDLLGKTDYEIFSEEFADAYYRLEKQVFAGADVAHEVQVYQTKDGKRGWVDNRKFPIRDDNGEIIGLYGIARDVTKLHRVQSALLSIADFVSRDHGDGIYPAMAEFIAGLFEVEYVHIGLLAEDQTTVRVVASSLDGHLCDTERSYPLAGTPCESVIHHRQRCCHARDVQQRFPEDADLASLQAEAYLGEPILDSNGSLLGLIVLASRRPLCDYEQIASGLQILASRAAADHIRRLNEQALRKEREALQLILDYAPIGIWLQNGKGKLSVVNKAFCGAMGIPEARFLAVDHYAELIPEPFREQCLASDAKALASDGISDNHQRLPFVDGKIHDLRVIKAVKRDAQGEPEFLVGLSVDITQDKLREQALQASEQRFRTLFECTPSIAVQGCDAQRRVIFWNQASEKLYGYTAEEAIGQRIEELIIPADMRQHMIDSVNIWNDGGPAVPAGEVVLRHKDGSTVTVFSSHAMQQGASGPEIYCLDIDLSEQKRTEQRLALALDATRVLIWELDFVSGSLFFAGSVINALGLDLAHAPETLIDWLSRVHPDDIERFSGSLDQALKPDDKRGFNCEYRFDNGRGAYCWLQSVGRVITRNDDGVPLKGAGYSINIDERKQAEEALRLSANVFTHTREGITITDKDGKILDVNAAFTSITGYSREDVLGKNPRILNSGKQDKAFYEAMWHDLLTQGLWSGEIWNRRKDQTLVAEMLTISAVRNEHGEVQNYIALFTDITPLKEQQARLEHIAHYDALTSLPNRLLLADRLGQAMRQVVRREACLAVVYLDLDGFKAVNDTHNHQVGDRLLVALARRMHHALRDGDTLARIGGDEFVAVLVDLHNAESSTPVLERLLQAAAEPVYLDDLVLQVSASIGVSIYPQNDEVDADQLVRQADQAMYQAKQSGKNRYHLFDTEHDRSVRGRHESLERIRDALNLHEFVLYYQPKVNMQTGQILGAEALIRWQHPTRGLLPPAMFLPIIENHSLTIRLGEWVLDTALAQIEAWRAEGLSIPVSVNVGALQLQHPDFFTNLKRSLSRHPKVQAGDLELEILETSALEDFVQVAKVMEACQQMGVTFAVDDFGTGYSSLTYLKQLPAAVLKIDQSFVRDMLDDREDLAILKAVLGLAEAFNRRVVAEGVETPEHGELLLRLGCTWGQGYAIARPMPATDIPHWLENWTVPEVWRG